MQPAAQPATAPGPTQPAVDSAYTQHLLQQCSLNFQKSQHHRRRLEELSGGAVNQPHDYVLVNGIRFHAALLLRDLAGSKANHELLLPYERVILTRSLNVHAPENNVLAGCLLAMTTAE